jgi:hypothetical protein
VSPARFLHLCPSRASRAVTLIELLVAMVGFLLIGGAILEIYDETQKAAQKMIRRQASIDFAVVFADRSAELLREAVRPANLDISVDGVAFQSDRFSVPAYGVPASNGLFLVTVRPRDDAGDGRRYEIVRQALGAAGDASTSTQTGLGVALTEGEPQISFRYATHARPGEPIEYRDRLAPGEWPAVVEISVQVQPKGDGEDPILVKTAAIPGRLPAVRPAAPEPTPTPLPAAPLAVESLDEATEAAAPSPEISEPAATDDDAGIEVEDITEETEPAEAGEE